MMNGLEASSAIYKVNGDFHRSEDRICADVLLCHKRAFDMALCITKYAERRDYFDLKIYADAERIMLRFSVHEIDGVERSESFIFYEVNKDFCTPPINFPSEVLGECLLGGHGIEEEMSKVITRIQDDGSLDSGYLRFRRFLTPRLLMLTLANIYYERLTEHAAEDQLISILTKN